MSVVLNRNRSVRICSIKSHRQVNELWISDYGSVVAVCMADRRTYEWIIPRPQSVVDWLVQHVARQQDEDVCEYEIAEVEEVHAVRIKRTLRQKRPAMEDRVEVQA